MRAPLYSSDPGELFSPKTIEDPYPLFERLRTERPLSRVAETGVHIVASWDLIEVALARESDFSANVTGMLVLDEAGTPGTVDFSHSAATQVIATADEPHHAVHREIAQPRLAAALIRELEGPVREWAIEAVEQWQAEGGGDFMSVAEVVPARAVAHILGLPDGDVSRYPTVGDDGRGHARGRRHGGADRAVRRRGRAHERIPDRPSLSRGGVESRRRASPARALRPGRGWNYGPSRCRRS